MNDVNRWRRNSVPTTSAWPAGSRHWPTRRDSGSSKFSRRGEVLPLAQATVSQHLKVLKDAGLLQGTIDGPRSCYCLDPAALRDLRRALDERLARLEAGCCVRPQSEMEATR
jgi:Bacterial regulatory protein, arsR family